MTTRQNQYQMMPTEMRGDFRRQVVNVRSRKLKAFSAEGIRTDIVILFFAVVALSLFTLLYVDISSINSAGSNIRKASARIESLKAQNNQCRLDIDLAMSHPVLAYEPTDDAFLIRMTVPEENNLLLSR